jgi:hypothetical protein
MKLRFLRKMMVITSWLLASALVAVPSASPASGGSSGTHLKRHARPQATTSSSSSSTTTKKKKSHRRHYHREVGQKAPTPDRIKEIQSALSRDGYYQGEPNGKLDSSTVTALQKFQTEHGLDPSGKLDAPTLQKMGLGSDIAGVSAPKPATPPSCCGGSPAGNATISSPPHPALNPSPSTTSSLQASSRPSASSAPDPKSSASNPPATANSAAPSSSSSSSPTSSPH